MFKKSSEKKIKPRKSSEDVWKILIVDDEPEVHSITKVALSEFVYQGKDVELISAYSGQEAKEKLREHKNIALIYLDVVMETDDAGLRLVEYIRNELKNQFVRIILRTGQPGQAPEREVIVNYDINDYKEKTDLDSSKLFTSTYAALRSYGDILTVEQSREMLDRYRQGLERVIDSSANLFELRSLKKFASGLLVQLGSLLKIDRDTLLVRCHGWTVAEANGSLDILAATGFMDDGNFEHDYQNTDSVNLPDDVLEALNRCHKNKANIIEGDRFVGYFPTKGGFVNLLYLDGIQNADEIDSKLIEIFCSNVTIAFDNLYLDRELYETQGEIIETLGDVVETRSKETANHVKRVAHLSRLLAEESGLSSEECDTVFMAAPMHDIGKVAIPDSILLKPGGFEPDEWEVMKTHAKIGQDIFEKSKRPVLQAAAVIAGQHHEKFDGSGYPNGLSGKNIHIYGRIVAITDVFDALIHKRCYKEAWPLDKVIELFNDQKGSHFDPELVDLFFAKIEEVKQIVATYPDRD